jgi:hypothetical protein
VLRQQELGIVCRSREVDGVFQIHGSELGKCQARQRRLADLPRAEDGQRRESPEQRAEPRLRDARVERMEPEEEGSSYPGRLGRATAG